METDKTKKMSIMSKANDVKTTLPHISNDRTVSQHELYEVLSVPVTRNKNESKFNSPVRDPTDKEKLVMIHKMVKIGIFTAMDNHTYTWNKETKLQTNGGGIGDKLAGEVARLYHVWFDRQFVLLIESANLSMAFYKRYVDDENIKAKAVSPGYNWDSRSSSLVLGCNPENDTRSPTHNYLNPLQDLCCKSCEIAF